MTLRSKVTDKKGETYEYKSMQGALNKMGGKAFEFALGMTHFYEGVFLLIIGLFEPESNYETYSNTLTSSLHDYVIITKKIEVYKFDSLGRGVWEPMASSTKKNTSARVNTVYYMGSTRYTPAMLDLGQVSGQAGKYFYDEARLTSLAKNTLSPLHYSYNSGALVKVNPDWKF